MVLGGVEVLGSFGPPGFIPRPVLGVGIRILALGFWVEGLGTVANASSEFPVRPQ